MAYEVFRFHILSRRTRTRVLRVEQLIFWGMWGDFHSLPPFPPSAPSIILWSLAHAFSLYTAVTYLLESLEIFRRRLGDMICMRFSTLSASSESHEPWGALNTLSKPFSYHFKWRLSQQLLCFPFENRLIKQVGKICFSPFYFIWAQQHHSFSALASSLLLSCQHHLHI